MMRGLRRDTASYPKPSLWRTPGRKFSTMTSARSTSFQRTSWPSGDLRLRPMLRLLRLIDRKYVLMPLTKGGPHSRVSSPRGGGSTFTIFAPISPSIMVQNGPERIRDRSSTKISSSGVTRKELNHEGHEGHEEKHEYTS